MPDRRPLTWYQGNPETMLLTVLDDETREPYDLTGVTDVRMIVKASKETADADAIATLAVTTGQIVVADAVAGECDITAPASATGTAGVFWYRADVVNGAGPRTVLYGPLTITDT